MFVGFNLKIDFDYSNDDFEKFIEENKEINEFYSIGRGVQEVYKKRIFQSIKAYIENEGGALDANLIMDSWFPKNKFHIFLSHSHNDLKLARLIAGVLKKVHNLDVFIDSNIWLNYKELLKIIDDKYCLSNANLCLYDYESCTYSASHIHIMLMNSLNNIIDNTECLFFLNTPNSVSVEDTINNKTYSPWVFSEIETSRIIRKITPERFLEKRTSTKLFSKEIIAVEHLNVNQSLKIEYTLNNKHLINLEENEFDEWLQISTNTPEIALNNLYLIKKVIGINNGTEIKTPRICPQYYQ